MPGAGIRGPGSGLRESDYRTPDYRTPDYRTPDYRTTGPRTPDYRTPDPGPRTTTSREKDREQPSFDSRLRSALLSD
jgi:hypothetical protein